MFEPQLHHPSDYYYLSNVANAVIIDCNESNYFNRWKSDHFGFRNPPHMHDVRADILLLGDSLTEGSCENEDGTTAVVPSSFSQDPSVKESPSKRMSALTSCMCGGFLNPKWSDFQRLK